MRLSFLSRNVVSTAAICCASLALIATSQSPIEAYTEEEASIDFALDAAQSRQYLAQIEHTDLGEVTGFTTVFANASVSAVGAKTALTVSLENVEDTGEPENALTLPVDVDGLTIGVDGTYGLNTSPTITLTAGETGAVEGTLRVDVHLEWYVDDVSEPMTVSVELVDVTAR